jgi:polysaccharide export outer membrane protein
LLSVLSAALARWMAPQVPGAPAGAPQPGAVPAPVAAEGEAEADGSYVIGPADQLSITVADEAELTGRFRIDNDGTFTYPYLGRLPAAGSTLSQLQDRITRLLANGYLRSPQVRVEVDQYRSRSVFVTGAVRNPNEYAMTGATMTLLQALALAGSPTADASNEVIVSRQPETPGGELEIIRINRKDLELGRAGYDLTLRSGDIINVPTAQRFYVDGYVRNPGFYVLDPGMTVQQAIVLAGGLNERGSDRGITATRTVDGRTAEVSLRLDDKVQANDVIRIRARFF